MRDAPPGAARALLRLRAFDGRTCIAELKSNRICLRIVRHRSDLHVGKGFDIGGQQLSRHSSFGNIDRSHKIYYGTYDGLQRRQSSAFYLKCQSSPGLQALIEG